MLFGTSKKGQVRHQNSQKGPPRLLGVIASLNYLTFLTSFVISPRKLNPSA